MASTDITAAPAPATWRLGAMTAACTLAVLVYFQRSGFAAALPEVNKALHLDEGHAGIVMAVFLFAYGLFEMPWGAAADRWGVRWLLPALVVGWSLATAAVGLVVQVAGSFGLAFGLLLALRFIFGMFQAGAFPLIARLLVDRMNPQERAAAQGVMWMSTRGGGAVAQWAVPALILFLLGQWVPILLYLGLIGIVWAVAFGAVYRDPAYHAARTGHATPLRRLLANRNVLIVFGVYGCGGFAANFFITMLPTYLETTRGFDKGTTKWLSSLPLFCGMAACVAGGAISDWILRRTGNRRLARKINGSVSMAIGALAWLLVPWAEGPWQLGILLCLIFSANDLCMGPAWAACADLAPRSAGALGGGMNMLAALTGAAGNLVAGYGFRLGLAPAVFGAYALAFATAWVLWLNLDASRPVEAVDGEALARVQSLMDAHSERAVVKPIASATNSAQIIPQSNREGLREG